MDTWCPSLVSQILNMLKTLDTLLHSTLQRSSPLCAARLFSLMVGDDTMRKTYHSLVYTRHTHYARVLLYDAALFVRAVCWRGRDMDLAARVA